MRLDSIHIILKEYIEEQEKLQCRWPCDAEYNVPTWDKIYDALEILDSIINYDPTPSGDSPYSDAEYIITPEERDRNAMNSKRESHAHRYYSHNW